MSDEWFVEQIESINRFTKLYYTFISVVEGIKCSLLISSSRSTGLIFY